MRHNIRILESQGIVSLYPFERRGNDMHFIMTVDITHHSSKKGTATYTGHQCHEESRWTFEIA